MLNFCFPFIYSAKHIPLVTSIKFELVFPVSPSYCSALCLSYSLFLWSAFTTAEKGKLSCQLFFFFLLFIFNLLLFSYSGPTFFPIAHPYLVPPLPQPISSHCLCPWVLYVPWLIYILKGISNVWICLFLRRQIWLKESAFPCQACLLIIPSLLPTKVIDFSIIKHHLSWLLFSSEIKLGSKRAWQVHRCSQTYAEVENIHVSLVTKHHVRSMR